MTDKELEQYLREFGFEELKDVKYIKECIKIAKKINIAATKERNRFVDEYELVYRNNGDDDFKESHTFFKRLNCYVNRIDWLKKLDVFVQFDDYSKKDAYTLDDSISYALNAIDGVNEEIVIRKIETALMDKNGGLIFPLLETDDCICKASICIINPQLYSIRELTFMIMHEFGHIYDMFISKTTMLHINRDLINNNFDSDYYGDVSSDASIIADAYTDKVEKRILINKIDNPKTISLIFKKMIYRINKSELRQRIKNFLYDLTKCKISQVKNTKDGLMNISEDFYVYVKTIELFEMLKECLSSEMKQRFVEDDIRGVYEYEFKVSSTNGVPDTYSRSYNRIFSNDNMNDDEIFDSFFDYHIENINNIYINNCISIVKEMRRACYYINPLFEQHCLNRIDQKTLLPISEEERDNLFFVYS